MLALADRSEPVDALTVSAELERQGELAQVGGTAYVHSLPSSVPAAAHVSQYGQIVRDRAKLRRLLGALREAESQVFTFPGSARELFDRTEAEIYKVAHDEQASSELTRLDEVLNHEIDKLEELSEKGVVDLDDERRAAMVSNLMVVLCSERDTQPIVNTGTLYT